MGESRMIRLVKQFAADHDQRVLAMRHVAKLLADQNDSPSEFLTRGIDELSETGRIRPAQANHLRSECRIDAQYTVSNIERMHLIIGQIGTSWEAIAEAAEQAPKTGRSHYRPRDPRQGEPNVAPQDSYASAFSDMFADVFMSAMKRDAHFAAMRERMNSEAYAAPDEPKPKVRYGRNNMPPGLTGRPVLEYDGIAQGAVRMIRFRLVSDKFTLMTELVAFGKDADTISQFAAVREELMLIITVPDDMSKFPQARIMI